MVSSKAWRDCPGPRNLVKTKGMLSHVTDYLDLV